eukprot:NODE_265_length_12372_cov_0.450012.p9 type:complete len:110 gc:universal NODE_265_length_12372_cov_0.450012:8630-8301(-)
MNAFTRCARCSKNLVKVNSNFVALFTNYFLPLISYPLGRALIMCQFAFLLLLVIPPLASTPDLDCGSIPFPLLSPPPCGWSTGFIATPLTLGFLPRCLFLPAEPTTVLW